MPPVVMSCRRFSGLVPTNDPRRHMVCEPNLVTSRTETSGEDVASEVARACRERERAPFASPWAYGRCYVGHAAPFGAALVLGT